MWLSYRHVLSLPYTLTVQPVFLVEVTSHVCPATVYCPRFSNSCQLAFQFPTQHPEKPSDIGDKDSMDLYVFGAYFDVTAPDLIRQPCVS